MSRGDRVRVDEHERIQAMLPWYVNGTLDSRGQAEVRAHLGCCVACREEIALHERVAGQIRLGGQVHPAPLASLDRLVERIEAYDARPVRRLQRWVSGYFKGQALERTVIAQAVTIFLLVMMLAWLVIRPEPTAEYRTLGSPADTYSVPGPQLHVVLHDSLTAAQVQSLLLAIDGRIVRGPAPDRVYLIELSGPRDRDARTPTEIAAWLRAQPGVLTASVEDGAEPR